MVFWGEKVLVCKLTKLDFCIELEMGGEDFQGKYWVIFYMLAHILVLGIGSGNSLKGRDINAKRDGFWRVILMRSFLRKIKREGGWGEGTEEWKAYLALLGHSFEKWK